MKEDSNGGRTCSQGSDDSDVVGRSDGRLDVLETSAEAGARFKPIEAYWTIIPARKASTILKAVDDALQLARPHTPRSLQHLRRIVKTEQLPEGVFRGTTIIHPSSEDDNDSNTCRRSPYQLDLQDAQGTEPSDALNLLVCATSDIDEGAIQDLLTSLALPDGSRLPLFKTFVPATPATSDAQAQEWNVSFWPTIYKKHNPFGAHPAIVSSAAAEIYAQTSQYMSLADEVAKQAVSTTFGGHVGAVAVERSKLGLATVVMVAGDARWRPTGTGERIEGGNPMAHAIMRLIGLIARRRLATSTEMAQVTTSTAEDAFSDTPLTRAENAAYDASSIAAGGYLCLDLEIYTTHEPCVTCSMALLHSRVGRVVFRTRMLRTGALTAEMADKSTDSQSGLGYGLFWQPSLNWKFLTWQWTEDCSESPESDNRSFHA